MNIRTLKKVGVGSIAAMMIVSCGKSNYVADGMEIEVVGKTPQLKLGISSLSECSNGLFDNLKLFIGEQVIEHTIQDNASQVDSHCQIGLLINTSIENSIQLTAELNLEGATYSGSITYDPQSTSNSITLSESFEEFLDDETFTPANFDPTLSVVFNEAPFISKPSSGDPIFDCDFSFTSVSCNVIGEIQDIENDTVSCRMIIQSENSSETEIAYSENIANPECDLFEFSNGYDGTLDYSYRVILVVSDDTGSSREYVKKYIKQ